MGETKVIVKHRSLTNIVLSLASLGAGAYHGYCDAQGIPFSQENTEWWLTYGPALVRGGVSGIKGAIGGGLTGSIIGAGSKNPLSGFAKGGAAGTVVGGGLGFGYGAVVGGIQTAIGYVIGYYVMGKIFG
ncbi:MAG: hypothetical protein V1725_06635 [archaeon]